MLGVLPALAHAQEGPAGQGARAAAPPPASPEARQMLDSAIALTRTYALWRDAVAWDDLVPRLQQRIAGARTLEEVYPALGMLTRSLGDRHSHVRVPPPGARRAGDKGDESSAPAARATFREPPMTTLWLPTQRVGYVRIPAHDGSDVLTSRAMATEVRAELGRQHARGACGYVVDVRDNTGGNMWPMLAALRPLLGEGPLGAFRAPRENEPWGARAAWDATDRYAAGAPPWADLTAGPVAVLTNGHTASSGEAVVAAFRGRPATRTFGTATAGLSTVNNGYPLPGGAMLLLTTAVIADRTGHAYGGPIDPDSVVAEEPGRDAPMEAAVRWLRALPECTR
jgi:hypothetical protein